MKRFKKKSRTLGMLRIAAFAIPAFVVLGTCNASRGQEASQLPTRAAELEDWKVDPMRGPVDLGLTDPALVGAIDVHVHVDPDAPGTGGVIRALDIFDAVTLAKSRGMRGFVFKTHQDAGSAGALIVSAPRGSRITGALPAPP